MGYGIRPGSFLHSILKDTNYRKQSRKEIFVHFVHSSIIYGGQKVEAT